MPTRILTEPEVEARLHRLAYNLWEQHYDLDCLHLVGLHGHGLALAGRLQQLVKAYAAKTVNVYPLEKHRQLPPAQLPQQQAVVLVDDVLYSGSTLYEALVAVQHTRPTRVQVLVMVDRGHRRLPISPDYVGLALSTTLQEYVEVVATPTGFEAWLK